MHAAYVVCVSVDNVCGIVCICVCMYVCVRVNMCNSSS